MSDDVYKLLQYHLARYPGMEPDDGLKLLYQNAMGPGHLIEDEAHFIRMLKKELALPGLFKAAPSTPDPLGRGLCRVHLSAQEGGPAAPTLARLCALTAGRCDALGDGPLVLESHVEALQMWASRGALPWRGEQVADFIGGWKAQGCPQPHHSPRYAQLYAPHYRVIDRDMALYLPVFEAVDRLLGQKPHVLVAVDGMSAAGKSTLAELMRRVYGCGAVHADDFFLQPHQHTAARLAQPGGNVDYERLAPVAGRAADDRAFEYEAYNCQSGQMDARRTVPAGGLTVLEGAYSLHPKVGAQPDLSVFLWLGADAQHRRIGQRNPPEQAQRFYETWIPMENGYFATYGVRERCDIVLDTGLLDRPDYI